MTKAPPWNPNAAATPGSGMFGLPGNELDASLVYLPVEWEATTSYGMGTSKGPNAILEASHQVDLFHPKILKPYETGWFYLQPDPQIRLWNQEAQKCVQEFLHSTDPKYRSKLLEQINTWGEQLNRKIYKYSTTILDRKQILGVIGGEHSVSFGAIQALSEHICDFGILHIDAHSDTRKAYEGMTWSHASIMYNVLEKIPQVKKIVQLGIRDLSEEEMGYTQTQGNRVKTFFDHACAEQKLAGIPWAKISDTILSELPQAVWISLDIDGLDPRFCPHTGTPVPGGLEFYEVTHLLERIAQSGRKIIGFDLTEVAPNLTDLRDHWDANVGARLLYQLSSWTLVSQNRAELY